MDVPSASVTYSQNRAVFRPRSTLPARSIRASTVRRQSSPRAPGTLPSDAHPTADRKARSSSSAPRVGTSSSHVATSTHRRPNTEAPSIAVRLLRMGGSVFAGVIRALSGGDGRAEHG